MIMNIFIPRLSFCCSFIIFFLVLPSFTLDTARHRLDPEIVSNDIKEADLKQFKESLEEKKKLIHKKLKQGMVTRRKKVGKPQIKVEEKSASLELANSQKLSEPEKSKEEGNSLLGWLRENLFLQDLSRTVTSMMDSSTKRIRGVTDSLSSTLRHMAMPTHIII